MIYTLSTAPYDWTFNTPGGPHTVRVNGTIQSNNSQLLVEPLRAGSGIALLPAFSVGADIQSGKLKRILDQFPVDRHELYVVYPHNRHLSPKVRVLIDLLADWFADGGPIACPKEAPVKAR